MKRCDGKKHSPKITTKARTVTATFRRARTWKLTKDRQEINIKLPSQRLVANDKNKMIKSFPSFRIKGIFRGIIYQSFERKYLAKNCSPRATWNSDRKCVWFQELLNKYGISIIKLFLLLLTCLTAPWSSPGTWLALYIKCLAIMM